MKKEVLDILDIVEELANISYNMVDNLYEKSNYEDVEFFSFSKSYLEILDKISNLKEKIRR